MSRNSSRNSLAEAATEGYTKPHKKSHFGFLALVILLALALAGGIAYELSARRMEQKTLAAAVADTVTSGPPVVLVGHAKLAPGDSTVEIPGQTAAFMETPLFARVDGYVKQRNAEIGQRVRKGEVLMELETPDLDQQIEQARATLAQSKAALAQLQATVHALASTMKLTQLTASRTKALADQGVLARQDADDKTAAADSAEANLHAAEENAHAQESVISANESGIRRLLEQKKYAKLEAPFDGVITARNAQGSDIGTLITSGSGTSAREIVRVSQISTLRVYVNVPQSYAALMRPGQLANLEVDEFPGRLFPAKVQSTTNALDPVARTLQTMLMVGNAGEVLLPGMFVKVRFQLPQRVNALRVPSDALVIRSDGTTLALVGDDQRVRIVPVVLGRDYGKEVEVLSGITALDRIVLNPSEAVRDGVAVKAAPVPSPVPVKELPPTQRNK